MRVAKVDLLESDIYEKRAGIQIMIPSLILYIGDPDNEEQAWLQALESNDVNFLKYLPSNEFVFEGMQGMKWKFSLSAMYLQKLYKTTDPITVAKAFETRFVKALRRIYERYC